MSGYIGTQPVPQATQTRDKFTATGGQTSFATSGYTPGYIDVYLNGVHLVVSDDYTAANGSDVVLASGATAGDIVEVVAYTTFEVLNQTLTGTTTVDVLNVTGAFTSLGIDDNATSTAVTIDASKNVGIGTTSPSSVLHIKAVDPTLIIQDSNNGTGGTSYRPHTEFWAQETRVGSIGMTDSNDLEIIADNYNSASINFDTGGSERLRIDSSGHLIAPYGITLGTAVGVYDASKTLDDYEEGTWTPEIADAISGGNVGSYSTAIARYIKIGNFVTAHAYITNLVTTGMTAGLILYFRGLPFTSAGNNQTVGPCITDNITLQGGRTQVSTSMGGSDSWVTLNQQGSGLGDTNVDVGDISSGTSDVIFTITYTST